MKKTLIVLSSKRHYISYLDIHLFYPMLLPKDGQVRENQDLFLHVFAHPINTQIDS